MPASRRDWWAAACVWLALVAAYNANGREIGSYDTRPTALAARELLVRGTLALNHVVGATPEYAQRWGVTLAHDGRYRSIFSPVAPVMTAAITWPFWKAGVIDVEAPLAIPLIAKATASVVVALAVTLIYFVVRRWLSIARAVALAMGLGLGTGLWSGASQTLWQSEATLLGLAIALVAFARPRDGWWQPIVCGLGCALAISARPQIAPAALVLLAGAWWRWGWRQGVVAAGATLCAALPVAILNTLWFANPLGPQPHLQELNAEIHRTGSMFGFQWDAWAGLLVSPSRGLLVFSPVVLTGLWPRRQSFADRWRSPVPWCLAACAAHYALFAMYSVWWGGHTYGPRYLLDMLPLACVPAADRLATLAVRSAKSAFLTAALIWSIAVAATGAFCYPNDGWNIDPVDVDRDHARLWSVSDNQIRRCWQKGLSPQNFRLFSARAVRRDAP